MSRPSPQTLLLALLVGGCSGSDPAPAPALQAQAPVPPAAEAALRARIVELEGQLAEEHAQRIQREQEWLQFTQGIGELSRASGVQTPEFATPLAAGTTPAAAPAPEPDLEREQRQKHGAALLSKLRILFFSDEVAGLDLLEAGEFAGGAVGPVVLRELDPDGRPYGTLCAERLHLEGSLAARTLTIVLEQGYERRGLQRFAFDDPGASAAEAADESAARRGTKRIELPEIDPRRWIEMVPELFAPSAASESIDDGLHDLTAVRVALNGLLREDASAGWWRISNLGGVQHEVLREVVLDGFDRDGRQERRLFADRLTILEEGKGVQLLLEHGAQVRGDQKLPFLDDHYRIFLPQAAPEAWDKSGVPLVRAKPAPR